MQELHQIKESQSEVRCVAYDLCLIVCQDATNVMKLQAASKLQHEEKSEMQTALEESEVG